MTVSPRTAPGWWALRKKGRGEPAEFLRFSSMRHCPKAGQCPWAFLLSLLISTRSVLSDSSKCATSTFMQQTLNTHSVPGSGWTLGMQS